MKKLIGLFLFLVLPVFLNAQSNKKNVSDQPTKALTISKPDSLKKSQQKSLTFTEGTIPSPEEQGFTKQTIDGKDIYYKESNGIRIQYEPK